MSVYNLVKTGVQTIVATTTSPVDVTLPGDVVKLGSAYPLIQVRETRLIAGLDNGVTAYLFDDSTLRIEFRPTPLPASEEIVVRWHVFDLENFGDDMKDVLFRLSAHELIFSKIALLELTSGIILFFLLTNTLVQEKPKVAGNKRRVD